MIRFYLSNNPASLLAPHVTIEAEYGDVLISGSLLTMAHHGPRKEYDQFAQAMGY